MQVKQFKRQTLSLSVLSQINNIHVRVKLRVLTLRNTAALFTERLRHA